MLILALDIGTSSCRTALFDERGARHADTTQQQAYDLHTDRDGRAELDPSTLLAAVTGCIDRTLAAQAKNRRLKGMAIAAVGTSCFWHSMVGCDSAGSPLTPVITWADSRCRDDAERLRSQLDERDVHARTGCMLRASFWPAKIRWLARTQRRTFSRVQRWMSPAEWILLRFCGDVRCAHGMATGTGLYSPAARQWDVGMLRSSGIRSSTLPTISDAPLQMRSDHAKGWKSLRDACWYPAIGDGAASNLGSGATRPGLAALNFGTSAAVRVMHSDALAPHPRAPFGLFCYRVDEQRYLIGGAISNAGNLRAWCVRELAVGDDEAAIEHALSHRSGSNHGLSVLPFWNAERAPTWREDVSGAIIGIRQSTTAIDLLQAITEATYHRLATIIERMEDQGRPPQYIVGGGIQRSPASLQRLADIIGQPLTVLDEPEASLRGAAVFALEKLGHSRRFGSVTGRTVRPVGRLATRYASDRRQLEQLESTLFPVHASPRRNRSTTRTKRP